MKLTETQKRAALYARGFMAASGLQPGELSGLYLLLALEQADKASNGKLTLELFQQAAALVWKELRSPA